MAARGYCGIAQDARLLYQSLAARDDVEVTGLVYHPYKFGSLHNFLPESASRGDRLANQAMYLWALAEAAVVWPSKGGLATAKKLQQLAAAVCRPNVRLDRLDSEMLWQTIWRMMFSRTLKPTDMPRVRDGAFLLSNLSDGMIYARSLLNLRPFKLDTRGFDYFIVQGARPFRVSPGTRQLVRYHDMIPMVQPDTMKNPLVIRWHNNAIRQCRDAWFVCSSEPTRDELTTVYPGLREQSCTIPLILSDAYRPQHNPEQVRSILELRRSASTVSGPALPTEAQPRYLMCVSTLEPRKNFVGLIQAFNALKVHSPRHRDLEDLKLVIVGSPGWKFEPIVSAMRDLAARGELIHLENVSTDELRVLHTHSSAFVFPSTAEGFGFPPLEAMMCDCPVIASDIPAHRWTMGDAALYCNPYDVQSIAAAIERLLVAEGSAELRSQLVARGRQRVQLYNAENCCEAWIEQLHRLKRDASPSKPAMSAPHGSEQLRRVA